MKNLAGKVSGVWFLVSGKGQHEFLKDRAEKMVWINTNEK